MTLMSFSPMKKCPNCDGPCHALGELCSLCRLAEGGVHPFLSAFPINPDWTAETGQVVTIWPAKMAETYGHNSCSPGTDLSPFTKATLDPESAVKYAAMERRVLEHKLVVRALTEENRTLEVTRDALEARIRVLEGERDRAEERAAAASADLGSVLDSQKWWHDLAMDLRNQLGFVDPGNQPKPATPEHNPFRDFPSDPRRLGNQL